jgi:hypothetical protein
MNKMLNKFRENRSSSLRKSDAQSQKIRKVDIRQSGRNWWSNIMVIKINLFKTLISIQFDLITCCELLQYLIQFDLCDVQFAFCASVHQSVAANLFDIAQTFPFHTFIYSQRVRLVCFLYREIEAKCPFFSLFPFDRILTSHSETFSESVLALPLKIMCLLTV